jgi:hypothetical protein
VKHQAQKHKITKGMNAATSWVPFVFTQKELNKARTDGLISDDDESSQALNGSPSPEMVSGDVPHLSLAWSFPSCP